MTESEYTPVPTFEDSRKGSTPHHRATNFTKRDCAIVSVVLVIAVIAIATTLAIGLPVISEKSARYSNITFLPSPSLLGTFSSAAFTVDAEACTQVGSDILSKGGSAVDIAVALLFCDGLANPQSMGIGGGVFITVYSKATGTGEVFDGREEAPAATSAEMFVGNSSLLSTGPLSVAVPGELKAYSAAHQKYGKLSWSDVIQPTLELCKNGFPVGKHLGRKLEELKSQILAEPTLKEVFFNNETNDVYKEGELLKRPDLANTLEEIAQNGADAFYTGELGKKFAADVASMGGLLTQEDLKAYQVKVKPTTKYTLLGDKVVHSVPPPGSGPVLSLILGILDGYGYDALNDTQSIDDTALMYHRIVEAFKYGYAKRTYLGDEDFLNITDIVCNMTSKDYADSLRATISDTETHEPEFYKPEHVTRGDKGTAHVSVLAANGDAVSATSTINGYFGAMLRSPSTGIILNNGMDDFSVENSTNKFMLEWSEANLIAPGKRPLSSMCPTIVTDGSGNVNAVVGGAGGSRITSGTALILFRHMYLKENIKQAIDDLRIHHQLYPNEVFYEKKFPRAILDKLQAIGHKVVPEVEDSAFQGITRSADGRVFANMDFRKGGGFGGV